MKSHLNLLAAFSIILSTHCSGAQYYETPQDYSVVNAIKKRSNLTQSYVDYNLLWLKFARLQDVAAAGIGGYASYKGGNKAYELLGDAITAEKGSFTHTALEALGAYAPTQDSKLWWALAGAAGVGYGAYKALYPRIARGALAKINAYADMCEKLEAVTTYWNSPELVAKIGTTAGNSAWRASNVARLKGIENLIDQGDIAIKLLDQLAISTEDPLRKRITEILRRLDLNKAIMEWYAQQDIAKRKASRSQNIEGAQQAADLALKEEQASALKVGKWSLAITTLTNAFDRSMKSAVYLYENKEKIAGGIIVASAAIYGAFSYLQSKIFGTGAAK